MLTIRFKRGDHRPKIVLALQDNGGAILDLTPVSAVSFVFKLGPLLYTRTGAIESPATDGKVSYTFVSGDWSGGTPFTPGKYQLEVVLTFSGGARLTVPTDGSITFILEDDLAT